MSLPPDRLIGQSRQVASFGNGTLHRAFVSVPGYMVEPEQPVEDRVVFFEVPRGADCIAQLKQVLACNWCADTEHWYERGYISNIEPAFDLLKRAAGNDRTGDLRIFEIGIGGAPPLAVGPKRIQYARASHVDLFTSPRVTKRLRRLLDVIDDLYAASAVAER